MQGIEEPEMIEVENNAGQEEEYLLEDSGIQPSQTREGTGAQASNYDDLTYEGEVFFKNEEDRENIVLEYLPAQGTSNINMIAQASKPTGSRQKTKPELEATQKIETP